MRSTLQPFSILVFGFFLMLQNAMAEHVHHHSHGALRSDLYGPIGVMAGHTHHQGQFMFGYQFMFMAMDGMRDGTSGISDSEVLANFMITPTSMEMMMHMFSVMYAPWNRLTFMLMLPYIEKSMDHLTRNSARFTTESKGLGDIKLTGIFQLWHHGSQSIHTSLGFGLPSGSIDRKDTTPIGPGSQLPYPMQLGSGSVLLMPDVTYSGYSDHFSWGLQGGVSVPLHNNENSYRVGEEIHFTTWLSYAVNKWWSNSLRLKQTSWFDYHGADASLNAGMVPTADPNLRGGHRLDVLLGIDLLVDSGLFKGLSMGFEGGVPVLQSLDGPQLETDWLLITGLRYQR